MTYEEILNDDIFFKAVWCNPNNARYKLLLDSGYTDKDISHMFEIGTMFEKVRNLVGKMLPEERIKLYTWDF